MNKVILMGRLTRDPEVRYSQGERATAIARYTLAVNRIFKREGDADADFINCVAFGRTAEFAERYFRQGSYVNKDGVKVYTTDVIVDEQEFAESKSASQNGGYGASNGYQQGGYQQSAPAPTPSAAIGDGFMNIPDGIDEELPFS